MLRFVADENFDNRILNGVRRRLPGLDVVRAQDLEIAGADDPTLLAWAAEQGRVLLSHDVSTLAGYAYRRVERGEPMRGVIEVGGGVSISEAISDILLIAEAARPGELEGQVWHLPLR